MNNSNNNGSKIIISYLTLRKAVGWIGILLPFALLTGNYTISRLTHFEDGCNPLKSSISHYYYTRLGDLFVGALCAVALFLFSYKGLEKEDSRVCNIAGFFALGIVTFPTSAEVCPIPCNLRTYMSGGQIGNLHFIMAALFFITLSYLSFAIFTKSKGKKTKQKIKRNIVYKVCAAIMVVSIALIGIYQGWLIKHFQGLESIHPVFWLETLALIAFGSSWLTKGEFILKDK
jgi:hypothetical protein